jgi:hypothetical protein
MKNARNKIDRKGFLLLLLYADGPKGRKFAPIRGRTRLAKLLFLLKNENWGKNDLSKLMESYYNFEPDNYGPFDAKVFSDIDFLRAINFINVKSIKPLPGDDVNEYLEALVNWGIADKSIFNDQEEPFDENQILLDEKYCEQEVSISPNGINFIEDKIIPKLNNPKQLEFFSFVKTKFGSWNLSKLLRYIYINYPEMAVKSKIRAKILKF